MKTLYFAIIMVLVFSSTVDFVFVQTMSQNQTRLENTVYPMGPDFGLQSPLKQFKSGIKPIDITCQVYLQLIFKTEDGSPTCVKPQTAFKLVEWEWGSLVASTDTMKIANTGFWANYTIFNGKILNITADTQSKSVIVTMQASSDGNLILKMPQELLKDPKSKLQYDGIFVLDNGQESEYKEIKTTSTDIAVLVPFVNGTRQIEIIGTYLISGH